MMFSYNDRGLLTRIEAKVDVALTRLGVVESRQATHEAICDVREKNFEEYKRKKEIEDDRSVEEWQDFRKESTSDRSRIRDEIWQSNTRLLWKVILAMGVLLAAATGAAWTLLTHHQIP